ncbi:14812_t:CDS:2 [Funneliformis geosporum]|uniref:14812_t:CDS:1 n=1 Tax=Funneliformis geosporum TaxID=1117311 RepID=A0A9W4SKZ7_9GLOM|nr:14812_t:CDS:2 [Funneliformis geosporum]
MQVFKVQSSQWLTILSNIIHEGQLWSDAITIAISTDLVTITILAFSCIINNLFYYKRSIHPINSFAHYMSYYIAKRKPSHFFNFARIGIYGTEVSYYSFMPYSVSVKSSIWIHLLYVLEQSSQHTRSMKINPSYDDTSFTKIRSIREITI